MWRASNCAGSTQTRDCPRAHPLPWPSRTHARNACTGECATALERLKSCGGGVPCALYGGLRPRTTHSAAGRARFRERRRARFASSGGRGAIRGYPVSPLVASTLRALCGASGYERPCLAQLLRTAAGDLTFWMPVLVEVLPTLDGSERAEALALVRSRGNAETAGLLRECAGEDVAQVRREILRSTAARLYVRAFGPLTVQCVATRDGPEITIDKKRLRLLLGLLVANRHRTLTREMAMEILWPDHDPAGGVNDLNQAVFQLRRHLNSGSKDPDRPQYVVSSGESLAFDPELVVSDLDEVRRLSASAPRCRRSCPGATPGSYRHAFPHTRRVSR